MHRPAHGAWGYCPVRWLNRHALVALPERIEESNAKPVSEQLLSVLNSDVLVLILDMTGTAACDHAGGEALNRVYQRAIASPARSPEAETGGLRASDQRLGCLSVTRLAADAALRERLRDVYWIGGGSGAGKSTVARRLADQHGLRRYATDGVMADHGGRMAREDGPLLRAFGAMDMDERWVSRSPQVMLETFHWFRGEGFGLIVDDLLRLAGSGGGVIAEGFRLLPRLVRPLLADPGHAVWLLPTPDFRRAVFASRDPSLQFWRRTSDPDRALRNLLERDRLFTAELRADVGRLALPVIEVDATVTEDELVRRVANAFGL